MLSPVRLSSVCNARAPTLAVEIFRNVSTPFGTLTIDIHGKFYGDRPGEPLGRGGGGVKRKRDSQIAILDLSKAISRKQCKIGGKLVLITNRKSYMSFRLVPKSVTLNDLEWRNGPYFALFHQIR